MDLSKLTPLPWEVDCYVHDDNLCDLGHPCLDKQRREEFLILATEMRRVDAEFCVLARKAFDVMMRRRDWVMCKLSDGRFGLRTRGQDLLCRNAYDGGDGTYFASDDPFTVWVEADKWYEQKEGNNGPK